ncbi:AFAD-like protein, partial [Mya arenaria]
NLEFHGVVRFYFQDEDHNVVTKCIRVSSTATTREVTNVLRSGASAAPEKETAQNFKRKLSKREKKEKKKADKERRMNKENVDDKGSGVAKQLYDDAPETSFTRSISNPEAVMRRRRQQKLEKKLQQFHGQNGQGGTLKIYGETLKPDIPYKTLLLSTADTVQHVIKEAMEKYGVDTEDTTQFVLVEVLVPPGEREYHGGRMGEERVMDDDECPLAIAMQHPPSRGMLMFQLKRKNADMIKPKYKRQRAVSHEDLRSSREPTASQTPPNKLPFLLTGPNIQPRHCVIAHTGGIVTVTPKTQGAETYVNNVRVSETTLLQHGMTVRFGKHHAFRFFDPAWEENQRKGPVPQEMAQMSRQGAPGPGFPHPRGAPQETNFDTDGRVETVMDQARGGPIPQRQESRQSGHSRHMTLTLMDLVAKENDFLSTVILDTNASATQFKLSPTYTLYLAVRFRLSSVYRPELTPHDRAHKLTSVVNKISQMVHQAIQDNRDNPASLAFWMANASEVLHFFKQDRDVHPFSQDSQEMLAEAVQMAFHHLVRCLQYDLQRTLPAFLDENDDDGEIGEGPSNDRSRYNRNKPTMMDILDTLSSAMNLLRRCRVNAALTIQLFSQLFHFINMWVFNILVTEKRLQLCTRVWGIRLKRRLGRVEAWAEKQGLELAADCHLCRIIQAAHLLQAPKSSPDDIANISSTCFKLNSLQLRELLERYMPEPMEPPIPHNLIDRVVSVAENMADDLIRSDGRVVQLEEDQDLQLPFLLPEDGYSCDTIKGVPNGLADFIEPLTRQGLCRMALQPHANLWTVYMSDDEPSQIIEDSLREKGRTPEHPRADPRGGAGPGTPGGREPEVVVVSFPKGDGQREKGIYIKSVVPEGAAAIDGRLQAGDQLLEVDGKSLVGLTQEKAAELMTKTGQTVNLKVAKQGAIYHGLAQLLSQPSPIMPRASPQKGPMTPNKQRPGEDGPPPYNGMPEPDRRPGMHKSDSRTLPRDFRGQGLRGPDSRSSPALNMKYRRKSIGSEVERSWHSSVVADYVEDVEFGPEEGWQGNTFPRANREKKLQPNAQSRIEIGKLKDIFPLKVLKQKVEEFELRDYRARAERLTPKGDYYGMKNFSKSLSVASYFSRGTLYSYPRLTKAPSLYELVNAIDGVEDDVFVETGLNSARSEPEKRTKSDQPMSAAERLRLPSAGNLRDNTGQLMQQNPTSHHYNPRHRANRDMMDKSKSIPNLHMDNSMDGRMAQGSMRPAHSVSALQQQQQQQRVPNPHHADYYNQPHSLDDSRSHDYENQPVRQPEPGRGYPVNGQPSPAGQFRPPGQPSPVTRPPQTQNFERPQSQFFPNQERPEFQNGRPKSEEINPERLRNLQDMDRSQGSPHDSFENRTPNYSNIRQQPNYANQGDIRKMDVTNPPKQPNLYENAYPRQPEVGQSFQQVKPRPLSEVDKSRPPTAPKPTKSLPNVQPVVEMSKSEIDNRMNQPNFYGQQKPMYPSTSSPNYNTSPSSHYQNTSFIEGRGDISSKMSPSHMDYMNKNPDDMAPELPPPPSMEELHDEELPPLPPPPVTDYRLEQKIREEQNRMMQMQQQQQQLSDPSYSNLPPQSSRNQSFVGNQSLPVGYQPPPAPHGYQPVMSPGYQPVQPQSLPVQPLGYNASHDYQNINYPNRSGEHSPSTQQNMYESYDPRKVPQQQQGRPPIHTQIKDQREAIVSPWQREEREKQQKQQQNGMNRLREMEIADLEARPQRSHLEEERLRKLKLDQEFQRRLEEVQDNEEEEDSDDERIVNPRMSIHTLQEDLVKSRLKLEDHEQKRQYEEVEKEKERMQRGILKKRPASQTEPEEPLVPTVTVRAVSNGLERRIEMFEREREEHRQRQQKRLGKQAREQEEYLRKQKRLEEERLKEKKRQEDERRREMERQRARELQAQKDAEEARAREEIRRQEEEYQRQQFAEQERRRREEEREIRVAEERKRLEALNNQQNLYYQQYENLPPQGSSKTMPDSRYGQQFLPNPPERGSSYNVGRNEQYNNGGYRVNNQNPPSTFRSSQENIQKKTVSFNTQPEPGPPRSPATQQPPQSSYQPFQRAYMPPAEQARTSYSPSQSVPVSSVSSPTVNNNDVKYRTQENTPTVIGSQEVYRDPRSRIEAKMANKNKQNTDRLSFRDKMKFFASEAGENTPKEKPKASTSQRRIESQLLYNGQ